jgi:hypothetical protein
MKPLIEHIIKADIKNNSPELILEIAFKDDFFNDRYVLDGKPGSNKNSQEFIFEIKKNGDIIGTINLKERNVPEFLREFLDLTDDIEFNHEFKTKIFESAKKQINDFFEFYDKRVVAYGVTLEGEVKRMQKVAGILKS